MRRREFVARLGGVMAAWPLAALAQWPLLPVVGYLHSGSPSDRAHLVEAFRRGLREGGYLDGKDVAIEYRWAEGRYDRLPGLAAELVKRKVAVIAAATTPAGVAAKAATSTIPIVFVLGGDPVKLGLVKSLGRPGGNVTGITNIAGSLEAKRIETLRDLVPGAKRIAYLVNPKFPETNSWIKEVQAAGKATATEIHIASASNEGEIDAAFAAMKGSKFTALLVSSDSYFNSRRDQIVALAARYAIPACYPFREFAVAGGLMSYGPDLVDVSRQQGLYTARILKGAKPAELPVIQAAKFDLVVNLKTARKLGLAVSRDFRARVDEVIE
jgi:putative ABC transport system substrate-binding protein